MYIAILWVLSTLGKAGTYNKWMKMLCYLIYQIKILPENFFVIFISFFGGMVLGV